MSKKINYKLIGVITLLVLACFACIDETVTPEEEVIVSDNKVRLELFTRFDPYSIPTSRGYADETGIDTKPWILVFKGNDRTFVEAVQTTVVSGTDQKYVLLTKQTDPCWLLILANPQNRFYTSNTQSYTFTPYSFDVALTGKSLHEACQMLRTEPLNNPQYTIPYVNAQNNMLLPMSHLEELPGGINDNTRIGSSSSQLELTRTVAKLEVVNETSDLDFIGIVSIMNASQRSLLHNLTGTMIDAQNIVEYKSDDLYTSTIADAVVGSGGQQSTSTNPVYLYEASGSNDMYLIIKGEYNSNIYYYKLAIVDNDEKPMDIKRNHRYIFNITEVKGPGYYSVADAIEAQASNTNLDYTITVRDEDSYEIISNNDYYMGVSNSHYIVYGDVGTTKEFHAFTLSTDCVRPFPDKKTITLSNGLTMENSNTGVLPIVTNTSPEVTQIKVRLDNGFSTGNILLELGNLDKSVTVERREKLSRFETTLTFPEFYCLSGYVEETGAKTWLKLVPSTGIRDVTDQIIVEDGIINVLVERNTSGERTGTIYLTTIQNPGTPQSKIYNIKILITQKEVINVR